jgi:predicted nucleic acid-binding protein
VRDRRFPVLADWFNSHVAAGRVLVCDLVILELIRLAPNETRARDIEGRLASFEAVPMPGRLWRRARELQLDLAPGDDHRRVPPADLLLAAAAQDAEVPLLHYDRDYVRIAAVSDLEQVWFVPDGELA